MQNFAQSQNQAPTPSASSFPGVAKPAPSQYAASCLRHDFSRISIRPVEAGRFQPKLAGNELKDEPEQEADRALTQVMSMPAPQPPQACGCGGACPKCSPRAPAQQVGAADLNQSAVPPIVHHALRSPGEGLDPATRDFMEPRFGHDFGRVRVHADEKAAASAHAVNALAYTVGRDVVLGAGWYAPGTISGKQLLAHELTHVVQQDGKQPPHIARFADTDHNIIEEVALTLAKLSPDEIGQIHAGNTKRDYSQSPPQLNLLLLCDAHNYGGYKAEEHFDNFRWDEALQKWQSRKDPTALGKKNPIIHIDEELTKFVDALPEQTALQHVGNAFHAVEDFFAHSNFVELINGDFRHGDKLVTGSVGGSDDTSILKILESISSQETAPFYEQQAAKEIGDSPQQSHAKMAKDYKSNPHHEEAVVLAALVIKDLGADIKAMSALATKEERIKYVRDVVMTKVKRLLRPPDKQDKWWETLRAAGGTEMACAIKENTAKTPVTVNQCILSPLRSIEASRDSNLKLLGPAFPLPTKHGHVWIQIGTGFLAQPEFKGPSESVEPRSLDFVPVGVQLTGRFR